MRLADRVAIVTGAAGGIGEAVAHMFSDHGATLLLADLNADGVAETWRHVEVHERRFTTRLGVKIRRTGRHAFVQMHDVLDLRIVEQRVEQRALGRAGIAEDAIDAVIEQRLEEDLATTHGIFSPGISQQSRTCY